MTRRAGTIERAYELAREGRSGSDIKRLLKQEGYTDAAEQLFGRSLQAALRRLRQEALVQEALAQKQAAPEAD